MVPVEGRTPSKGGCMANSEGLHETRDALSPGTIDRHRALTSLQEELEAADWYDQRVDATQDAELASILAHNRDEEKEHAMMLLEWLRRHDPTLDRHMRTYLFSEEAITGIEAAAARDPGGDVPGSLGLGGLKGRS
jgi:ferritin-like protein